MDLNSFINNCVCNDQTEMQWNPSKIHDKINKEIYIDFKISVEFLELVIPYSYA